MYGESKLLRTCGDLFKHVLKTVTPFQTLANEAIVQCISYGSFRCCDVAVAFFVIRDTPYVRMPIRKCVRAVKVARLLSQSARGHWFVSQTHGGISLKNILSSGSKLTMSSAV